jgi:hypothetical protein
METEMKNSKLRTSKKKRRIIEHITVFDNVPNIIPTTTTIHSQQQWLQQEEGTLVMYALSFLDVKTLLQKESVNKT